MINRENYLAVKEYLKHQAEVLQRDALTTHNHWGWLKHLLRWADEKLLSDAPRIRPVYPRYLLSIKRSNRKSLSADGLQRACLNARMFFTWLRQTYPRRFRELTPAWVDTIQPPRMPQSPRKEHQAVTLDMVRQLVQLPVAAGDIATRRDIAAAAFLFLSGMRATAFGSLPIECVNIAERMVLQYPTMGVRTKNRKAAVTRLLEIPDLLDIVVDWDRYVREHLPLTAPWYTITNASFGDQELTERMPGIYRGRTLNRNIKALFEKAKLPTLSAHKFRHGHAVYGLQHAKEVADLKAVSMNLMHSSIGITDSIYAVLSDNDMQARIAGLGIAKTGLPGAIDPTKLEAVIQRVLAEMENEADT